MTDTENLICAIWEWLKFNRCPWCEQASWVGKGHGGYICIWLQDEMKNMKRRMRRRGKDETTGQSAQG